jgi:EmrB/QacA subfamily drug resistance transporter
MLTSTRATRKPTGVLALMVPLMLVLFISNLDQTIVATALPSIGRSLQDLGQISWIATAYLLTSAITTLIFGKLGDMYGRKMIFQVSVVVFLIGSALCGTAQSMIMLIAFRALQGVGGGGLNSLIQAIMGDVVPARERSKYQAALGIVATVALIAGPFLGGLFSGDLSWRWIFYINIPIGAVALIVIAARLRLPRRTTDARADIAGGLLAALFTTAVLLLTTWGGTRYGWGSPAIIALALVVALTLTAYLAVERRAAAPITPLRLFRNSVFTISAVQFLLATMVLFVAMLYVPLFLQTVQGKSPFTAGLYVIPMLVGLVAATAVAGPVIARTGRYKIYPVIGAVLTGVSMWLLSLAGSGTPAAAIIGPLIVAGAGVGLFVQVALLAGQNAADYADLGAATGTLNFFKSMGGAFGAALFGTVLAAGLHAAEPSAAAFHRVFLLTVPFMALALALGLVMREKPLSREMVEIAEGKAEAPEY